MPSVSKRGLSLRLIKNPASFYCTRSTPFGPVAVLWAEYAGCPKITRVFLSGPDTSVEDKVSHKVPDTAHATCKEITVVADDVEAYLCGEDRAFSLDTVHIDLCPPFHQRVLLADYGIPRGSVSTYRHIAAHLGDPNAARAVGNALAANPFPIIIPCHRVVRSDGALGGYQPGPQMKRALLEMEGVKFVESGRVAYSSNIS